MTPAFAEAVAVLRALIFGRFDEALQERAFHKARGQRTGNVEALAAALKANWARGVLLDIDARFPPPPSARPIPKRLDP